MADDSAQEKTEQPTPRKREDAKDKGSVAKSQELNSVAVLIAGMLAFKATSGMFAKTIQQFVRTTYHESSFMEITVQSLPGQVIDFMKVLGTIIIPILAIVLVAALISNVAQIGFMVAKKALIPDFKKVSPLSGLKRLFSLRSIVELLKGIIKITILALISYFVITKHQESFLFLPHKSASEIVTLLSSVLLELTFKIALALLVMAAADFAYQKYEYEKGLKMSKQDVKDDNKQSEGNPEIKGRIKSIQMQQARKRMMQDIPEASVVVTNPTHIAVALKYEPNNSSDAPKIIAMGKNKLAERIKEIARENDIPVMENKPLARSLFESCEVGMEIPSAFYQAVAEILSSIYQKDKNRLPLLGGLNG